MPLFDQGRFLGTAVDSVVAVSSRTMVPSSWWLMNSARRTKAATAAVAAKLLGARPWLPATLVRRGANGGLSAARNTTISVARGEYVLPLDADNLLYPSGLRTLLDRMTGAPAE